MYAETCHRANDALAAYRGGLDRLAVLHDRHQGHHAGYWKMDLIDLLPGFEKHEALGKLHRHHAQGEVLKFLAWEGGQ
jgi:hypothetical protein